jgi:hypothetical protein
MLEGLLKGRIKPAQRGCEVDGWLIISDDREFQKRIPLEALSSPTGPVLLIGRFELTSRGEWSVVPRLQIWPYTK